VWKEADVSLLSVNSGVVHIIEDLLIPHGAFRLTAEKVLSSLLPFPFLVTLSVLFPPCSYLPLFVLRFAQTLIGLNATKFITLLRSVNLTSYVDASSSNEAYTILAPIDDLPSFLSSSPLAPNPASRTNRSPFASLFPPSSAFSLDHLPPAGSEKLADLLRYHILPGRLRVGDLVEGGLVGTEMRMESLRGGRQVLRVSVKKAAQGLGVGNAIPVSSEKGAGEDDGDDDDGEREDWEEVRFGEVDVVAEPIEM
jgi:uncharacterized surface protein with fasciclin (FAS1) repeats